MMTITNKLKPLVLGVLVASCLTVGGQKKSEAAPVGSLIVDDFSVPGVNQAGCNSFGLLQCTYSGASGTPPNYLNDQQTVGGTIGTTRKLSITDLTGNSSTALHGTISTTPVGSYRFRDIGVTIPATGTLLYNSGGAGLGAEGNVSTYSKNFVIDLTSVSNSSSSNLGTVTPTLTLFDGTNTVSKNPISGSIGPSAVQSFLIFDLSTFGPVDLTSLDSIQLDFSTDAAWNGSFVINEIYLEPAAGEIPEPTSVLSIVGIGVLGGFASRRPKKN